ncbi:MAG: heavy-metal-associated domain-containing protein [Ignavibacteria bacterium]|nr:heavy-metal-associated domain-containing protein [Ignavibacteria bacterium]
MKLETIKIKCTQMSCEGCKNSITSSIHKINGIKKLDINLKTKIIKVTFDDSRTNEQEILNAIYEAGYEAELLE